MNNWPSYLPTSMTYNDFLTDFQFEDSPESRQIFEQTFDLKPGVDRVPLKNFGFSPPSTPELGPRAIPGDVNPFYSSSDPIAQGGYVPHVTEHYTVAPATRPDNTWDFGAETPFSLGRTAPPGPQDPTVLSAP